MLVYRSPEERKPAHSVVAIGSFDGVHRGHAALLAELGRQAQAQGAPAVVYTFDPPTRVLLQEAEFLSTLPEKLRQLSHCGVGEVVAVPFTREYAARPKEAFLQDLAELSPKAVVVGQDFHFGKGRAGSADDLRSVTPLLCALPIQECGGAAIKSSRVRRLLASGDVGAAAALLGRLYSASGTVMRGDQLGRQLGYPTANLRAAAGKALPRGVFAAWAYLPQQVLPAMVNIGTRPTVSGSELRFEVHLLDYSAELYGQEITVAFAEQLRPERRFAGVGELRAQLAKDEAATRAALAGLGAPLLAEL